MSTFHLPDLGEGLAEAEIVAWHVGVGDHVVADQPLLSVETDKAVVEIPCPQAARVSKLHVKVGEIVAIGAPLVDLSPLDARDDPGTVVGELPGDGLSPKPVSRTNEESPERAGTVSAMPAVRALAKELGVELAGLDPSGPNATITRADVEQAYAKRSHESSQDIEPMRGVRRAMSRNMAMAHSQVVPATLTDVADIHQWLDGNDFTLRLIRAICVACTAEPAMNASYLGLETGRRINEQVNIGVALDTSEGLFVPVLRDAAARSPDSLKQGLERLMSDVRARSVPREELRGATITLSNFGMLAGLHAALVVLPPQVAIVGAGRANDSVVAQDGEVKIHRVLPLSITFDHRAVVGSEAARFMAVMCHDLALPS